MLVLVSSPEHARAMALDTARMISVKVERIDGYLRSVHRELESCCRGQAGAAGEAGRRSVVRVLPAQSGPADRARCRGSPGPDGPHRRHFQCTQPGTVPAAWQLGAA